MMSAIPPEFIGQHKFLGESGASKWGRGFTVCGPDLTTFRAEVHASLLGRMAILHVRQTSHTHVRTAAQVKTVPLDLLALGIQRSGSSSVTTGDETVFFEAGTTGFITTDHPATGRTNFASHSGRVYVPFDLLGSELDTLRSYGAGLLPRTALTRATESFLLELLDDPGESVSSVDLQVDLELATIDLIRSTVSQLGATPRPLEDTSLALRTEALRLIGIHHIDPQFDASALARMLHVSVRHLYRSLSGSDVSIAGIIADRRLARAKSLIVAGRTLGEVTTASGYRNESVMRAQFRAAMGMTPSDYRATRGPNP